MAEKRFDCDIGYIVTQDSEGNYLPFLMRARSKEIIWGTTNAKGEPQFSDTFLELLHSLDVSNVTKTVPNPSYQFDIDGWQTRITEMNHVVYVKEIPMREMEEYMELIYTEEEIATGVQTNPGYREDQVLLENETKIRRERKFYDAEILLPLPIKRQFCHVGFSLNATGPKYKATLVNGNLTTDDIMTHLGMTFMVEDVEMDDFDTISDYGEDGISFQNVEYFEPNSARVESDSYFMAVEGETDEIHEFIEIEGEFAAAGPDVDYVPGLDGLAGFGSETGASDGAIALEEVCYIDDDPESIYNDSRFTPYEEDTNAVASSTVELYEDGIAFPQDLNIVDPNAHPDIELYFDNGYADKVLIVDFTMREKERETSTLMIRVEGELADSDIYKDREIHPVDHEI